MFSFDRLKEAAAREQRSTTFLCAALGKSTAYLSDMRRDGRTPSPDQVAMLAAALHTTPAYLNEETDDPAIPPVVIQLPAPEPEPAAGQTKCNACHKVIDTDSIYCKWCGTRIAPNVRGSGVKRMGNGCGSVYKTPSGKWAAEVRQSKDGVILGRKKKSGFATRREAMAYLPTLMQEVKNPGARVWTVKELFAEVQKSRAWRQISDEKRGHYMTAYKRCSGIHNRDVTTVRYWELQELVDTMPGAFYPKRDCKTVLNKIWTMAIKMEALGANDNRVSYIDLPSKPLTKKDARTPEEIAAIWADWSAGNLISAYALIMAYTGTRYGEIATQKLDRIDLDRQVMVGGIKTEAGIDREIPLRHDIVPVIRAVMPSARFGLLAYEEADFYREWHTMNERLGIRDLNPHCHRHTYITRLQEVHPAINPAVIKACAGHAPGDVTDQYTHVSLQAKLEAVERATFAAK